MSGVTLGNGQLYFQFVGECLPPRDVDLGGLRTGRVLPKDPAPTDWASQLLFEWTQTAEPQVVTPTLDIVEASKIAEGFIMGALRKQNMVADMEIFHAMDVARENMHGKAKAHGILRGVHLSLFEIGMGMEPNGKGIKIPHTDRLVGIMNTLIECGKILPWKVKSALYPCIRELSALISIRYLHEYLASQDPEKFIRKSAKHINRATAPKIFKPFAFEEELYTPTQSWLSDGALPAKPSPNLLIGRAFMLLVPYFAEYADLPDTIRKFVEFPTPA